MAEELEVFYVVSASVGYWFSAVYYEVPAVVASSAETAFSAPAAEVFLDEVHHLVFGRVRLRVER